MAKLRVHNIESGPASSDVALGISGDTVAVSSDSLKLNTWKDSGGNTLFVSDGAGTLSNVNSTFSGAGPKLILSQTADASTSISFTANIDSTYDKYMFIYVNINPATNSQALTFNGSTDGGSNYNVTKTTTAFSAHHQEDDGDAGLNYRGGDYDLAQSTSYQYLTSSTGNEADEGASGILYLYAPSSTTFVKQFYSRSETYNGSNEIWDLFIAGYMNTTTAVNAIDFKFTSGNINEGTIKMYGVS